MAGKKQPARLNPVCKVCDVALDSGTWTESCRKSRRYICKVCWVNRQKRYADKDPDSDKKRRERNKSYRENMCPVKSDKRKDEARARYFLRKYGVSVDRYNEMLISQNYKCSICSTEKVGGRSKNFHIDHCHESGVVRGLLCMSCNTMLGMAKDNTEVLSKAILYLDKFNRRNK